MNLLHLTPTSLPSPRVTTAARRYGWLVLLGGLAGGLLLVQVALPGAIPTEASLYVIEPTVWLFVALFALGLWSAEGERLNLLEQRGLILSAAMLGGVQVAAAILLGLVTGFGHSPYARSLSMIALNVWYVATRLVGVETARWYLGKAVGRFHAGLGFVVAWILPIVWLIPFGWYAQLGSAESAIRVSGQTLLPAAAENLLAAFLALAGGPLASMAYRGVLLGFEWLSPVLPDLPWLGAAFVGVLAPVVGLILLRQAGDESDESKEPAPIAAAAKPGSEKASAAGWLLVAALGLGVIWLNSGFLGVRPSLISGNSMNPTLYPGDVVVTREVSPDAIRVGDLIRFRRDGLDVVHRVVAVEGSGSTLVFTTRGDNNNVNDAPVLAEQVQGRVVITLPKIGWIGIGFRRALAWVGGLL